MANAALNDTDQALAGFRALQRRLTSALEEQAPRSFGDDAAPSLESQRPDSQGTYHQPPWDQLNTIRNTTTTGDDYSNTILVGSRSCIVP
jgi:hypothetical protein